MQDEVSPLDCPSAPCGIPGGGPLRPSVPRCATAPAQKTAPTTAALCARCLSPPSSPVEPRADQALNARRHGQSFECAGFVPPRGLQHALVFRHAHRLFKEERIAARVFDQSVC